MGIVSFDMSMSLDGFVAGPNDEVDRIFGWYFMGDTELTLAGAPMSFKVSKASARHFEEETKKVGAIVTGRKNFELAHAWGGTPPLAVHHFVLTHHPPKEWIKEGSPFTFVTDGIESAVAQAKKTAGNKNVVISTPNVLQQALKAKLVDEINIDLAATLLGKGVRLFENLEGETIDLKLKKVVEGAGVTHLQYKVLK